MDKDISNAKAIKKSKLSDHTDTQAYKDGSDTGDAVFVFLHKRNGR